MPADEREFSFRTRENALARFRDEPFDILVIGGGITGAATARDAASRGLKVALVEKGDFASGTSSRSSKLIHGGLRYLENLELGLVFEALSERAFLLKNSPGLVKPLPFFLPVYKGDPKPRWMLSLGLWLYDILALFRAPGFHKYFSKKNLLGQIPFLKEQGLVGGFRYHDATMWDDRITVETLRQAHSFGASCVNYVEALSPKWSGERIIGFRLRDFEKPEREIEVKAHRTIVCAGPWTDQVGLTLSWNWKKWINPSKGVHLVFDFKKLPVPGAVVMSHPEDGRISFVIPRLDFGEGVSIVGTTDVEMRDEPDSAMIDGKDVAYLMNLLGRYFPTLKLSPSDIISAYVGVRPLMGGGKTSAGEATVLQEVSREHHIERGPGGSVVVAGGKYTTHRKMAREIVDFTLHEWGRDAKTKRGPPLPSVVGQPRKPGPLPEQPLLNNFEDHLKYSIRNEMVIHLEDFYLRRTPIYLARADHGLSLAESLAKTWATERGIGDDQMSLEIVRLKNEIAKRSQWRKRIGTGA